MNRILLFSTAFFLLLFNALWAGEITVTGQGRTISSGDISPLGVDGTNFGQLAAGGGTITHTFVIKNIGNSSLLVAGIMENGPAFSLIGAPVGATIQAGNTRSFEVRFNPTSAGVKTATITIANDDSNESTYTFLVTGEGLGNPEINLRGRQNAAGSWVTIIDGDPTPRALDGTDFGDGDVGGTPITKTFQIENTGDGQLTIDSITEGNDNFSVSSIPATVGVNQTQTFIVTFDPQSTGTKTTTVTIQNNDASEDPYTFSLTGEGKAPDIKVRGQTHLIANGDTGPRTTDGTDFGQIAAGGGSVTKTFVIHNDGNQQLNVSSVLETSNAFSISGAPNLATPISAGGSDSFTVTFNPTSAGVRTTTVMIRSDDPAKDPYSFDISGEGLGNPEILVQGQLNGTWIEILDGDTTPHAQDGTDFANATVGGSGKTRSFRIRNTGDAQLTINSITESSPDFLVASVPSTVGVSQTKTFTITFAPSSAGTKNTTITIQNNDPNEDPHTFRLTGVGRAPDLSVRGQGNLIANGDTTPRAQDGTNFGQITAAAGMITKTFVIHNDGNTNLTIDAVLENGPAFSISGAPTAAVPIPAGSTVNFDIIFNPVSGGTKTATVQIRSNDPAKDSYTFDITGEGLGSPEIAVRGRINIASPWSSILDGDPSPTPQDGTDFGEVTLTGPGLTRIFEIGNTGAAQLTIGSITINSPHFSVSGIPNVVGVNQTQTFSLTFDPTARGDQSATLTIQNNDPNEDPFTFAVTGKGKSPDLIMRGQGFEIPIGDTTPRTADGTDFGQVAAGGGIVTRTFVIHNEGNDELNVNSVLENGAAFSLAGVPGAAFPIPAGSSNSFEVTFDPTSGGIKTATVQIRSNDPNKDPYTFEITAEALGTPEIELRGRENISSSWLAITKGATSGSTNRGTKFPDTSVNGDLSTVTFQIRNIGGAQITIDSITINSPDFVAASVPSVFGVNQTQTFTIAFNPSSVGNEEAIVTVRSNDPDDDPFTFAIEGLGLDDGPSLQVRGGPNVDLLYNVLHEYGGFLGMNSILTIYTLDCDHGEGRPISHGDTTPSELDGTNLGTIFPSAPLVNDPAGGRPGKPHHYFRLSNNGDSDLIINGISFTGADVTLTHNEWAPQVSGQIIPAGGCATLPVEFTSPVVGLNTATVNIVSSDPDHPVFQFDISIEGIGGIPDREIEVLGPEGNILRNNSDTIDFGTTTSAGQSNTRTLRLQNVGSSLLQFSSIISNSSHFIITPAADPNLSAGEWVDLNITFSPTATGQLNGTVTIESNADTDSTFTFEVVGIAQGNGGTPPEPEAELVVFGGDPMFRLLSNDRTSSLLDGTDAGTFEVGDEIIYSFRARNTGDAPLNFTRAPFAVGTQIKVDDLEPTLNPGEHDDFTLTFTPRNPGDYQLVLALQSDDPAGQFSFAIGAAVTESPVIESAGIEITGFTLMDGDAFLSFNTPAGATYRVVTNSDLGSTWTLVEGGLSGGGFQSVIIPNGGGSTPRRFYRVEKE